MTAVRIIFRSSKRRGNSWKITVKKGSQRIHRARVDGANTPACHERLVRNNLYDLVNVEKIQFDLYEVWKEKMETLQRDIIDEANRC